MNVAKQVRVLVGVAVLIAALVMTVVVPALAVEVGDNTVNYVNVKYDYPSPGQSTWFYEVTSGPAPAISHVTFEIAACMTVLAGGTFDPVTYALSPGSIVIGTDPTTGVTGVKFDTGFEGNETRYYYFTVNGNYSQGDITVATKSGGNVALASITGPNVNCKTFTCEDADLDFEKYVNGQDADTAPGLSVVPGSEVTWTYVVKNSGFATVEGIAVGDDKLGVVCTIRSLAPGEEKTCTKTGIAVEGQYFNRGKAGGKCVYEGVIYKVLDIDYAYYFGEVSP